MFFLRKKYIAFLCKNIKDCIISSLNGNDLNSFVSALEQTNENQLFLL